MVFNRSLRERRLFRKKRTDNGSISENIIGYKYFLATTLKGFEAYEDYKEGKAHSNFGFMALKFNSDEYKVYEKYWSPTVEKAMCPLHSQKKIPEAGIINNIMEDNIRRCKFLIADLTPFENTTAPNPNVMWEAGFAHGLGKHVFYVCNASKEEFAKKVFDTAHHSTIFYNSSSEETMKDACEELEKSIFNTFAKESQ